MLWATFFMTTLAVVAANFQLEIIHTNDMHSRFFQTNKVSSECSDEDAAQNNCYGGFARVSEAVRLARYRNQDKTSLFLIAGDIYQGTIWFTTYKWKIVSTLTNMLKPDAMSLGNHEFDDGIDGLIPFINNATFPVLASNLNLTEEPRLKKVANLKNSTIFTAKSGEKIAVVGYVTPETKFLSLTENVNFMDEVLSINAEIQRLKIANPDLKIFIALGHSGYEMDKKIAEFVPDIDLVIGGHTNTFLYSGNQPDSEVPEGLYPTWVKQKSGRSVPVVQAYAYTKYLGQLDLEFDDKGELIRAIGNPLLLDNKVEQDPFVLQELATWKQSMTHYADQPIGQTKVLLQGDEMQCRLFECNLGNVITDALVDYMANLYQLSPGGGWTNASIAIYNGGAIRSSIDVLNRNGVVTLKDILAVMPFINKMVMLKMKGSDIFEMLEWSVADYSKSERRGKFLQVSGLKIVYDLEKPNNQRVVKIFARCHDCRVPIYSPVELEKTYNILMPIFTAKGGDGFSMVKKLFNKQYEMDETDADMFREYFVRKSPIHTGTEGRITFVDHTQLMHSSQSSATRTKNFLFLLLLLRVLCFFIFGSP